MVVSHIMVLIQRNVLRQCGMTQHVFLKGICSQGNLMPASMLHWIQWISGNKQLVWRNTTCHHLSVTVPQWSCITITYFCLKLICTFVQLYIIELQLGTVPVSQLWKLCTCVISGIPKGGEQGIGPGHRFEAEKKQIFMSKKVMARHGRIGQSPSKEARTWWFGGMTKFLWLSFVEEKFLPANRWWGKAAFSAASSD